MNQKIIIFSLFVILVCTNFSAKSEPLSLEECLKIGLKNNNQIVKAQNDLQSAQKDVKRARGSLLPSLSTTGSYSYRKSEIESSGSPLGDYTVDGEDKTLNSSITLSQPIYNGGKIWAGYSSAKVSEDITRLSYEFKQQTIVFTIKQYYFGLLKTQKLLEVAEETVKQSEKYLEKAQTMKELGLVSHGDVLKAEVNLSQDKLDRILAENNVSIAKSQLAHILGLDIVEGVEVMLVEESRDPLEYDLVDCIERALEKRPEISQTELAVKLAKLNVRTKWANRIPSLNSYARYSWNKNEDMEEHQETTTSAWSVGVQLDLNIFDGFATESDIQKAKIGVRDTEIDLEQLRQDITLEVKEAYLNLEETLKRIEVSSEAVESAEEDLRLAEQKYELGKSSFIDLTDAQLGLTLAKSHYIQAVYDYYLAEASLVKAMGE